jgi:hypothetical protein
VDYVTKNKTLEHGEFTFPSEETFKYHDQGSKLMPQDVIPHKINFWNEHLTPSSIPDIVFHFGKSTSFFSFKITK